MVENDYDLIQRLKDINAILMHEDTSVLSRYGGIAELALFRDIRKVGVLTVGLIDANPQVRALAAEVLDKDYDLGESSREVQALLENNAAELRDAYELGEQDHFAVLLEKMGQRLRLGKAGGRSQESDGDYVEYDRRHVLIILQGLGRALKKIQLDLGHTGTHPLKLMLEDDKNHWILSLIQNCLEESADIFCRRHAILVVGELGLDFDRSDTNKQAYNILKIAMDSPNNRNNYLVTKDVIRSMTALVKLKPELRQRFFEDIRAIFSSRQYSVAYHEIEIHRNYTRQECITALKDLYAYEEIKQLIHDGEERKFLHMMAIDKKPEYSKYIKESIIKAFLHIYTHEPHTPDGVPTPIQLEILTSISTWVGSRDSAVRVYALDFFEDLQDFSQVLPYLLQSANLINDEVYQQWTHLRSGTFPTDEYKTQCEQLEGLLPVRKRLVMVFGTLFA
ncbi:MAG TPA: hypothetical protein VN207_07810, partial [Ktedonobacteraceae bacterium]|nr:hypothetical protein [Ktedonobacteraceae bacterium]